jgi:hypothetical protein
MGRVGVRNDNKANSPASTDCRAIAHIQMTQGLGLTRPDR